MYIYLLHDNIMDETPSYKVGLENVFVSFDSQQDCITFYLPGDVPLSLHFSTQQEFEAWETHFNTFPLYDAKTYQLRGYQVVFRKESGHVSPKAPYYNMKYMITTECLITPNTEILSLLKIVMQRAMMVPEIILYVGVLPRFYPRSRVSCTTAVSRRNRSSWRCDWACWTM